MAAGDSKKYIKNEKKKKKKKNGVDREFSTANFAVFGQFIEKDGYFRVDCESLIAIFFTLRHWSEDKGDG